MIANWPVYSFPSERVVLLTHLRLDMHNTFPYFLFDFCFFPFHFSGDKSGLEFSGKAWAVGLLLTLGWVYGWLASDACGVWYGCCAGSEEETRGTGIQRRERCSCRPREGGQLF